MNESLKPVECIETAFRLPEFWDRSVLYFANLKSLFLGNVEQTEELARLVGEIDSYGGRLASVLNLVYRGKDNVLLLERLPEPALLAYFESDLGLTLPRIEILSHEAYCQEGDMLSSERENWVSGKTPKWIDGYVTDLQLEKWAEALELPTNSSSEGSRIGNNKTLLYHQLLKEGLPTPETRVARNPSEVITGLEILRDLGYRRAAVRAAIGASGIGMIRVDCSDIPNVEIPKMLFHGGHCLVQGWFEKGVHGVAHVDSPSVQLFLDADRVHLFDVTDQILSDESVHQGNLSPPLSCGPAEVEELMHQARVAGRWLHEQGYRGTASVDFLVVTDTEGEKTVYVCEVNARITGATYPSVVGRHLLPGGAWLMRNLRFTHPIEGQLVLDIIANRNLLFRRGDSSGVVPLNFNFGKDGLTHKGQFLCLADSVDACFEALDGLVQCLPAGTGHDRD